MDRLTSPGARTLGILKTIMGEIADDMIRGRVLIMRLLLFSRTWLPSGLSCMLGGRLRLSKVAV